MKGICHVWSRGRHFSPSLPGDRYLKLGSKSDHRAEISGNIVWFDALAPRPEVLRSFSLFYANDTFWVLFFAQANKLIQLVRQKREYQSSHHFKILSFFVNWCFLFSPFLQRKKSRVYKYPPSQNAGRGFSDFLWTTTNAVVESFFVFV